MEAVDYAKMADPDFYHHYMMVRLHEFDLRYEGRKQGIAEGAHDARIETARGMLSYGIPKDKVAEISGLPLEEVQSLAE